MPTFNLPWLSASHPKKTSRPSSSWPGRHKQSASVPARTGPLGLLTGKNALLLADVENLSISASDLGKALCYASLDQRLRQCAGHVSCHAFFSRKADDRKLVDAFEAIGWRAHPRDIQVARTARGVEKFANSDHMICFGAGMLVVNETYDVVVVATGDGALGCDLAKAIRQHGSPEGTVVTMSLAGSTSNRLNAAINPDFEGNIEIGADCLKDGASGFNRSRSSTSPTYADGTNAFAW
jgi:hypothetical protein